MIYLHNATLYTPSEKIDRGAMLISGDTISSIGNEDELACPPGAQSIDIEGLSIVPGFIDLQINGAFGMDFTTHPETIWQVGERLPQFGVTSFLPTIVSSPPGTIRQAQEVLKMGPPEGYRGAQAIGFSPQTHGARCRSWHDDR
jgi:N-acetylglucosamine-6-phosphate deacetylase